MRAKKCELRFQAWLNLCTSSTNSVRTSLIKESAKNTDWFFLKNKEEMFSETKTNKKQHQLIKRQSEKGDFI